jgi:DNA topoisomerase IB
MEHEAHHCGGKHSKYTIKHCSHDKHSIDEEKAVGHGSDEKANAIEITVSFPEECSDGGWHIESGKIAKSASFPLSKRAKTSYVDKREEESGNITYVYSDKHVKARNKKKAKKILELSKSIKSVRKQIQKDISSKEELLEDIALVVGLIDGTYERVGNPSSAKDDHYGVTTWRKKHVKFSKGKATIKYVGKSGVKQEKIVELNQLVAGLQRAVKDKKENDEIFPDVNGRLVNLYLKPYNITAKDIRGFHANEEMKIALKSKRKGTLPKDQKEKEKKLKEEFKSALEIAAKKVGHEPSTLKNQYLIPSIEENYLTSGKIKIKASLCLSKRAACL